MLGGGGGRQIPPTSIQDNPLWISWHDSASIPSLNPQTVMDYFCRKVNPFYDRTCNNEIIKMQRLSLEHLNNMTGLEYILLHVSEPILYVIRKQHRHSPTEATPLANYYIINGVVYKAPDLASVLNSRILSTVVNLQSAFEEASSYARYHPSKGYTWDFSANKLVSDKSKKTNKKDPAKDDSGTVFQKQRVDMLLGELLRKFPPPVPPILQQQHQQNQLQALAESSTVAADSKLNANVNGVPSNQTSDASPGAANTPLLEPKIEAVEDMKPPPEKKPKVEKT